MIDIFEVGYKIVKFVGKKNLGIVFGVVFVVFLIIVFVVVFYKFFRRLVNFIFVIFIILK